MYQKTFGEHKPVYDGQKNVYTVQPLPIGKEKVGNCIFSKHAPQKMLWEVLYQVGAWVAEKFGFLLGK